MVKIKCYYNYIFKNWLFILLILVLIETKKYINMKDFFNEDVKGN